MTQTPSAKNEPHRQPGDPTIIPPQAHVHLAGHHWVTRIDFDGRPAGTIVLQWQPQARRWCLPDQYARGQDYNVEDYQYTAPCPMPLWPHQLEELRAKMRELNDEEKKARDQNRPMQLDVETWRLLYGMLYKLLP